MNFKIPPIQIKRSKPLNLVNEDLLLFKHVLIKKLPPVTTKTISQVTVIPNFILLKNKKNLNLPKLNSYKPGSIKERVKYLRMKTKNIAQAVWCVNIWSENYFHWYGDVMPKLYVQHEKLKGEIIVILPKYFQQYSYIKESLLAFPKLKFIWQANYEKIKVQNLIYVEDFAPTGNFNEKILKNLSEDLRDKLNLSKLESNKQTFINREKTTSRNIMNWNEILPILTSHNITPIVFEKYSWQEQLKIAASSKILIGVHGAGLTNMLFMKPNSVVVELRRKDDKHNNCYFAMASALNHNYYYLLCDVDDIAKATQKISFI